MGLVHCSIIERLRNQRVCPTWRFCHPHPTVWIPVKHTPGGVSDESWSSTTGRPKNANNKNVRIFFMRWLDQWQIWVLFSIMNFQCPTFAPMAEVCDANLKVVNQQWMHSSQNWSTNWVSSCDSMVFFESWGDKQNLFTNLGSCMNLSVAWMRSARCTIDHWRFSGIQSISDCKVWTKAAEKKSKLSWQRVGKLLCRGSYFHDQNPAPLGMVHNLSHTSLWGFSVAPRNEAKQIFW